VAIKNYFYVKILSEITINFTRGFMSIVACMPSQLTAPIGNLEAYIAMVNRIPLLSFEEEQALAREYQTNNNLEAAKKLVLAHLRYVVKVARSYDGYGLQQADLIQEGNIGLMKAVKRFDPALGVRLVSFAMHWIKAEMHDFIIRNWRIVKVATTKAQRKLFFNLRRAKKSLNWLTSTEVDHIAKDLNVSPVDVKEMEMRLHAHDADVHYQMDDDEESRPAPFPLHYLADPLSNPAIGFEENDQTTRSVDALHQALEKLDLRSRTILERRWLQAKKATLEDLAQEFGVSCERIRQLEKVAMQKLAQWIAA
jgi:RNA polymerase sigma-32 factor